MAATAKDVKNTHQRFTIILFFAAVEFKGKT
jgi:hypothetical protein